MARGIGTIRSRKANFLFFARRLQTFVKKLKLQWNDVDATFFVDSDFVVYLFSAILREISSRFLQSTREEHVGLAGQKSKNAIQRLIHFMRAIEYQKLKRVSSLPEFNGTVTPGILTI